MDVKYGFLRKRKEQGKLFALEMDYLQKRLQKIPNTAIRSKMQEDDIFDV